MNKRNLLLSATIAAAAMTADAQTIQYKKAYGGTWYDYAAEVIATSDGGMVLLGAPMSSNGDVSGNHGWSDAWVVKLAANGNIDWKRSYGGSNGDGAQSISATADGGYVFAGYSTSNDFDLPATNNGNNLWVAKIGQFGLMQWSKTYGGSGYEYAASVFELSDGTFIVGGNTNSTDGDIAGPHHGNNDCWVLKLDASGNLLWEKSYGGSEYDVISKMIPTNDGGFAFLAYTQSEFAQASNGDITGHHGGWGDMWLVKLDASGTILWNKCIGGSSGESAGDLIETSTGDLVLLGSTSSQDADAVFTSSVDTGGVWITKLDNAGNMIWEVNHGRSAFNATGIAEDAVGNLVIVATSSANSADVTGYFGPLYKGDMWVMAVNPQGTMLWQDSYGGNDTEYGHSITITTDGNIAVLGETASNNNGEVNGSGYHYGTETIHPPNSPSFTVNTNDLWMLKIAPPAINGINDIEQPPVSVYPNPSNDQITISAALENTAVLTITDVTGRVILSETIQDKMINKNIKVSDWAPGIYNVKLTTEQGVSVAKLIVAGA